MNLVFFDLEGPLSPQDNAYELMKLFPGGDRIFEVISRYDDLITLEGKEGYEPGDTLALIVPFLVSHNIPAAEISNLAARATLVRGAKWLVGRLKGWGWGVFCISTSYEQYATVICRRVGIALENLACTAFDLDSYRRSLMHGDLALVAEVEKDIIGLRPEVDDERIKARLDRFYWADMVGTRLGEVVAKVRPMGGQRKVGALGAFTARCGERLGRAVVIGDSITDFKMLQAVDEAGGLAIAFNANEYALPHATIGLASTHLSDLRIVFHAWEEGGRGAVEGLARERERRGGRGNRGHLHWLSDREDIGGPLAVHKRLRRLVRESAAGLG